MFLLMHCHVFDITLIDVESTPSMESTPSVKSQLPLRLVEKNAIDLFIYLFIMPPPQSRKEFTLRVLSVYITDFWYIWSRKMYFPVVHSLPYTTRGSSRRRRPGCNLKMPPRSTRSRGAASAAPFRRRRAPRDVVAVADANSSSRVWAALL